MNFVVAAPWLITMAGDPAPVQDGAIVVRDGRIVRVVARTALSTEEQALPIQRLVNHVLMPGLINAHGHAAMALLRGFADDVPFDVWLKQHVWPVEARHASAGFVADGTRLAIAEMLLSGTTCFADMYFFPETAAALAAQSGMRAQIAFPVIDFANAWAANADEAIHLGLDLLDAYRNDPLLRIAFGPHSAYTVGDAPLRKIATLAAELGTPVQMHVHETAGEVTDGLREHGCRPMQRLQDLQLLAPGFQAVHMTQVDAHDVAALQHSGASVIHCPQSNLRLASGVCPIETLHAAGVTLGLGTDGAAANNGLDMFREANVAALVAKLLNNDAAALPAYRALHMATLGSAAALGLGDQVGSLETGKWADFIAIDLRAPAQWPLHNVYSQLVHTAVSSRVSHVWVAGQPLVVERQLQTIDQEDTLARAAAWQRKLQS